MQILSIGKKKRINALAFSPSGRDLATTSGDGQLRIWDRAIGAVRLSFPIEESSCGYDIAYLDENRLAFTAGQLRWLDIGSNRWHLIAPYLRWARQLRVSPDGVILAEVDQASSTDWTSSGVILRDTRTWQELPPVGERIHSTGGLAFSPDGKWIASGHIVQVGTKQRSAGPMFGHFPVREYEYVLHVRDLATGQLIHEVPGWQQGIRHLAFSHDGKVIAGAAGPRLRIWNLEGDRELALHKRGTKHFQGLSFTADGRYLASVSNDETVRIWDTRTWQEHTTFTWEIGRLLNIALAPDGCCAAAGSDRGQIILWDVDG
jgi:WD40 repeat protein